MPFSIEKSSLYVVATPIGNLKDISERALDVLRQVDCVAAEDTRVTGQLLRHFGIQARLISVREHNEREAAQAIISRLAEGQSVAQVSDAGTPAVSDPGARLVEAVLEAGYRVSPIPGPSAVATALSASGLSAPHFLFYGFLPPKSGPRQKAIASIATLPYITVFYEAPHRIVDTLSDLVTVLGESRVIVLARELTKTFETIRRCPAGELLAWVQSDSNQQRGEFVLLVDAAVERDDAGDGASHDGVLKPLVAALPVKQAVQLAMEITGASRNTLYERALQIKQGL